MMVLSERKIFQVGERSFSGFLSRPDTGRGRGILLLHAWWGLNDFMLQTCERLAGAGFVALAPDYYAGEVAQTIEAAQACRQKLDRKATQKLVTLAVEHLGTYPGRIGSRIGVIGFSLGCSFALEAARSRSGVVQAVVLFYGTGGGNFDRTQAVFSGHFAANDRWGAGVKKVDALAERIQAAGQPVEFFTYPGTEHWFMESDRPEYQPEAAELAWKRTLKFLDDALE